MVHTKRNRNDSARLALVSLSALDRFLDNISLDQKLETALDKLKNSWRQRSCTPRFRDNRRCLWRACILCMAPKIRLNIFPYHHHRLDDCPSSRETSKLRVVAAILVQFNLGHRYGLKLRLCFLDFAWLHGRSLDDLKLSLSRAVSC